MSQKTYTLTLTEEQAGVLSTACEVLARLGIGQFRDALRHLPLSEPAPDGWHEDLAEIGRILQKHTISNVDGCVSSLSMRGEATSATAKTAWDMHHVIRHRLAWDWAKAQGLTDGIRRNWGGGMLGVQYDEPFKAGTQPLATMVVKDQP